MATAVAFPLPYSGPLLTTAMAAPAAPAEAEVIQIDDESATDYEQVIPDVSSKESVVTGVKKDPTCLDGCTAVELRSAAKTCGLLSTGKKADVLKRIKCYVDKLDSTE